jgi:conjugal transfer pilus assembly protein TrbC
MISGCHYRIVTMFLVCLLALLMQLHEVEAQVGLPTAPKVEKPVSLGGFSDHDSSNVETEQPLPGNAAEIKRALPDKKTQDAAKKAASRAVANAQGKEITNRAQTGAANGTSQAASGKARYSAELNKMFGLTDEADAETTKGADAPPSPQIVIFASASMPIHVLRAYAAQLDKVGGALVFRGSPGGISKIYPFAKLSRGILLRDEGCKGADCSMYNVAILMDPLLFRFNQVSRVPASIILERDLFAQHCDDPEGVQARGTHVVYGDATIKGLLEEHKRSGDLRAMQILSAIGG